MAKQTENNVGIYLRLSQEDSACGRNSSGDSLSIDNQKLILTKFVQDKGWNLVDEYIDDGYTGTDFSRPGVQRLLGDAQTGKINIIVVKDLSRFGRNYIEVGRYIDYIFPINNIRFIALNDGVDTADRNSTALEMMPIVNLVSAPYGQNPKRPNLPILLFQMINKSSPPDILLRRAFFHTVRNVIISSSPIVRISQGSLSLSAAIW